MYEASSEIRRDRDVAGEYSVRVPDTTPDYIAMLAGAGVRHIEVTYNPYGVDVTLPAGCERVRTPDVIAALHGLNSTHGFDAVVDALPTVDMRRLGTSYIVTKAVG